MNHCSLQQNAFMSRDESRGFVPIYCYPMDYVVCPKPRRANNVIRPLRLHFRYKVSSFIIFVHPNIELLFVTKNVDLLCFVD